MRRPTGASEATVAGITELKTAVARAAYDVTAEEYCSPALPDLFS